VIFSAFNRVTVTQKTEKFNLKDNTSLDSPSGARDAVMPIHLEKNGAPTSFVVASQQSNRGLPFMIALHNKTTLNAVVIRKISNAVVTAALSEFCGHQSSLVRPFRQLMLSSRRCHLRRFLPVWKHLTQIRKRRTRIDLSLNQADLSSKVDRNQQDMSLKAAQLDLKVGLVG
jgi:hypothetical protein